MTNFAYMNLKFIYVIALNERSVCAKNQAEIFLERMFGEKGLYPQSKIYVKYKGRVRNARDLRADEFFLYEFQI